MPPPADVATSGAHRLARWVAERLQQVRFEQALLAAAVVGAIALVLVETPILAAESVPVSLAFGLATLHAAGIPAALRRPQLAATGSLVAVLALQVLTAGSAAGWPWSPVLIVVQTLVLAAAATRARLPAMLVQWVLAVASSATLAAVLRPTESARTSIDVVVFGSVAAGVIIVVLLLTQWQRVRGQLLRERRISAEEAAARLVVEERARIARELHDVVAHSLSIITVQASTARFRNEGVDAESVREFERIAAQSRQALDEMRGLLRVLRSTDDRAERGPQPGLVDIASLVAQAAATGTSVTLTEPDPGWDRGVGALTGLTAFRIVQEATSNALRHAPGAAVTILLGRGDDDIELSVVNEATLTPPPVAAAAGGHGLTGMRERAASAGGSVDFAVTAAGGFAVRARLPIVVTSAAPA